MSAQRTMQMTCVKKLASMMSIANNLNQMRMTLNSIKHFLCRCFDMQTNFVEEKNAKADFQALVVQTIKTDVDTLIIFYWIYSVQKELENAYLFASLNRFLCYKFKRMSFFRFYFTFQLVQCKNVWFIAWLVYENDLGYAPLHKPRTNKATHWCVVSGYRQWLQPGKFV